MKKDIKIDIARCFKAIFQNWYLILLCAVVLGGIAFGSTVNQSSTYYAKSTLYSATSGSYTQTMQGTVLMRNYSEIATSRRVAERAAVLIGGNKVSGSQISSMVSVKTDTESALMYITARSVDPELAIDVANAVAESFAIEAKNITGDTTLQVLDKATGAMLTGAPAYIKYTAVAVLAGIIFPCLIIVIKEIFSDEVYHVEDASLDGEIDVIGIIPQEKEM